MKGRMTTVVLESPFGGNIEENLKYLRKCMADCIKRGEAPFASHGLYTQPGVLDDDIPEERQLGIQAGFEIGKRLEKTVVYIDKGISRGMRQGIEEAKKCNRPVEYRGLWTKPSEDLI